jgi:hypothetical protein
MITLYARNAEYNPKVGILFLFRVNVGLLSFAITLCFTAVIMRIRDPKTTVLIVT